MMLSVSQSVSLRISRVNKDPRWKLQRALKPQVFLSFSSLCILLMLSKPFSHTQRAFFFLSSNPRATTFGLWKRFHSRDLPHAAGGKPQQTLRDETRCSTRSRLRGTNSSSSSSSSVFIESLYNWGLETAETNFSIPGVFSRKWPQ